MAWKEYLEWRSSTYNLLVPPGRKMIIDQDERKKQLEIVSNRIWKSLKSFVKPGSTRAQDDLERIVSRSMWLDLDFRQQMAQFEVKRFWKVTATGLPQYFGKPFDSSVMSDQAPSSRTDPLLVEMIAAPALIKSHDWSEAMCKTAECCLLKAQVFCSLPPHV